MRTTKGVDLFDVANQEWDAGRLRKALDLFREAAESGVKYAYNSLAYFYDNGLGTRVDKRQALYWYRRGARAGDACAYANLAICYREQGKRALALRWFRRAVDRGDGDSALELAKMYLGSLRTAQKRESRRLLQLALASKATTPESRSEARRLLKATD